MVFQAGSRPENVLIRAQDLIAIGKSQQALESLYDMLQARRFRQWVPAHEELMKKFIELCVQFKNNRLAKEGMHQYRNLSQHQNPKSLMNIINYFLDHTEKKTRETAKTCGDLEEVAKVQDLENDKSPEMILMSAVSSDKSQGRTEAEHLVPALKFQWESFRMVLEILRHNPKLEGMYHETAIRTFGFCEEFDRQLEFRKLCETLRQHFLKSREPELAHESAELHIKTRFEQLRVSSKMRLWNEGFRTIEDIHAIFSRADKRPSSQLEATYYQKLTELFLVSKNYLFHAYAYKAYYILSMERNKSLTEEQSQIMASCVLLSAMAIPIQEARAGTTYAHRESQRIKNRRMAQLLGFDINPKRKSILQDLLDQDILDDVIPQVRDLYLKIECTFAPLNLVNVCSEALKHLTTHETLKAYVPAIEHLLIIRVISQLSQVFYSVRLDTLEALLKPLGKSWMEIEDQIVQSVKQRQVDVHAVRLDHILGCVHFGEDFVEEKRMRRLITDMSRGLSSICIQLEPKGKANLLAEQRAVRARTVLRHLQQTHQEVLKRKDIIEKRKEDFQRLQSQRRVVNERRRQEMEKMKREAEAARVAKQVADNEAAKLKKLEQEKEAFLLKQELLQAGLDPTAPHIASLSIEDQQILLEETKKASVKETLESERKIKETARKLDALVRATREKEIPKLKILRRQKLEQDEKDHVESWKSHIESSRKEHDEAIASKKEYSRMASTAGTFEEQFITKCKNAYEKDRAKRWQECDQRLKMEKLERARRKRVKKQKEEQFKKDEALRLERDRKRQAEEEARRKEQEEEEERERARLNREREERAERERNEKYLPPRSNPDDLDMDMGRSDRYRPPRGDAGGDRYRPPMERGGYGAGPGAGSGAGGRYRPPMDRGDDSYPPRRREGDDSYAPRRREGADAFGSSSRGRGRGGYSSGRGGGYSRGGYSGGGGPDNYDDDDDGRFPPPSSRGGSRGRGRGGPSRGRGGFGRPGASDSDKWR